GRRHGPGRGPDPRRPGVARLGGPHRPPAVPGRARLPAVGAVREAGDHMTTFDPRAGAGLVAVGALGTAPPWARTSVLRTLIGFFTLLALATMWNLLAGYAGLVSIGQQAWIGVGAYGLYWLSGRGRLPPFAGVAL